MNALVGQKAKANFALSWLVSDERADDGGRKDGGDFCSAGAGGDLRRGGKFKVLHDSFRQWENVLNAVANFPNWMAIAGNRTVA